MTRQLGLIAAACAAGGLLLGGAVAGWGWPAGAAGLLAAAAGIGLAVWQARQSTARDALWAMREADLVGQVSSLSGEREALSQRAAQLETTLEKVRRQAGALVSLRQALDQTGQELKQARKERDQAARQAALAREEELQAEQRLGELAGELSSRHQELASLQAQADAVRGELSETQRRLAGLTDQIATREQLLGDLRRQHDDATETLGRIETEREQAAEARRRALAEQELLAERLERLSAENAAGERELTDLRGALESESAALAQAQAGRGQAIQETAAAQERLAALTGEITGRERALVQLQQELVGTQGELEQSSVALEQARGAEREARASLERMSTEIAEMERALDELEVKRAARPAAQPSGAEPPAEPAVAASPPAEGPLAGPGELPAVVPPPAAPPRKLTRRVGSFVDRLVGAATGRIFNLKAGCYGKLPIHNEFIKHRAELPEVTWLDRWFQEGIYAARQRVGQAWPQTFDVAPPVRIFFHPPGTTRVLIGCLLASRDRVGRRYPFLVFTSCEVRAASQPRDIPGIFEAFLDQAHRAALGGGQGDLPALRQQVDQLDDTLELRGLAEALARRSLGQLLGDALGQPDPARGGRILCSLLRRVERRKLPEFALRLPPAASAVDMGFWLTLLGQLIGHGGLPTLALWHYPRGEAVPTLTCRYGALGPEDFLALLWPQFPSQRVLDLALDGPDDPEQSLPPLDTPLARVVELLIKQHRRRG